MGAFFGKNGDEKKLALIFYTQFFKVLHFILCAPVVTGGARLQLMPRRAKTRRSGSPLEERAHASRGAEREREVGSEGGRARTFAVIFAIFLVNIRTLIFVNFRWLKMREC